MAKIIEDDYYAEEEQADPFQPYRTRDSHPLFYMMFNMSFGFFKIFILMSVIYYLGKSRSCKNT